MLHERHRPAEVDLGVAVQRDENAIDPNLTVDTDAEVLVYHYDADSGVSYLGINLLGYDSAGWPFVY